MATGLITLADAKASLGITTNANDDDLQRYIEAATPVIEDITGPQIAGSRVFTLDGGNGALVLGVRFNAVTSVVESGTTITDYVADPGAGVIFAGTTAAPRIFDTGTRNIVVTVTVGNATIPPNVTLAARELVRHWWQLGRQGTRPQFGDNGQMIVANGFGVPTRRVMELLHANANVGGFA